MFSRKRNFVNQLSMVRKMAMKKRIQQKGVILNDEKKTFGCIKDEDRVFQNLYGRHDWRLLGACKRGDWHRTKDLICQGPEWLLDQVKKSGLRGRGGAGYPAAMKWGALQKFKSDKTKVVIINGAEGEPGTCKDREIMRHEPHKILEGLLLCGVTCGARHGIIYIRSKFYNESCNLQFALTEAYRFGLIGKNACGAGYDFDINLQRGGRYLCGEETALVSCLMGKIGRPRRKPPFLREKGYFDHPAQVVNVETVANFPTILRRGPKWYASMGRSYNSGTKLFCISGHVNDPCTVEEEMSTPLREIIEKHAGGVRGGWENLRAIFPGGTSTKLIGPEVAEDVLMDFDCLESAGSALGSGAIIVIDKSMDLVQILYNSMLFYKHETCKQCTQCREGSVFLTDLFKRFLTGNAQFKEINFIEKIAQWQKGNTICALADAQAIIGESLVDECREDIEARIKKFIST